MPQNVEAEEAVLGAILIDESALPAVASFLRPRHFYVEKNGWIFEAFLTIAERHGPVDMVTVCDELERREQLQEVGSAGYVTSLLNAVPTAIHAVYYARLVERAAILRQLIGAAGQIAKLAYEATGPADAAVQQALALVQGIRSPDRMEQQPVGAILRDLAAACGDESLSSGFSTLDARWAVLRPGHLVLLTAPTPDAGAAWAYQVALRQALRRRPVAIFSPRLDRLEVTRRLWAQLAGLSPCDLQIGHPEPAERPSDSPGGTGQANRNQVQQALDRLSAAPLYVDDTPELQTGELRARVWDLRRRPDGLSLALIDSLQFLGSEPAAGPGEVWLSLKRLARAAGIPILVLSQPDALQPAENPAPLIDTTLVLAGSADREGPVRPKAAGERSRPDARKMTLNVTQDGRSAALTLCFHSQSGRFTERERPARDAKRE